MNRFYLRLLSIFNYRNKIKYARLLGVKIGEGCKLTCDPYTTFGVEPWLISIGNHVEIASGCRFLTHDGAIWTIRRKYPNMDIFGPIKVGDNVFIGTNAIILPNVTIGDNCIISAGAVVTKNVPQNSVFGGCPAHFIKSYEDYEHSALKKCTPTKNMPMEEKQKYLKTKNPNWFV